jgi:hypothetical protein
MDNVQLCPQCCLAHVQTNRTLSGPAELKPLILNGLERDMIEADDRANFHPLAVQIISLPGHRTLQAG